MNKSVLLSNIAQFTNQKVQIKGWLYNKRFSGKILFLQIRDGTGIIQAVWVRDKTNKNSFDQTKLLTLESSIIVTGKVKKDKRAPTGFELDVNDIQTIQKAKEDYPIGKKEHGVDFLLDHRHLWLRSPRQRAIQVIRNQIIRAIDDFYHKKPFI